MLENAVIFHVREMFCFSAQVPLTCNVKQILWCICITVNAVTETSLKFSKLCLF